MKIIKSLLFVIFASCCLPAQAMHKRYENPMAEALSKKKAKTKTLPARETKKPVDEKETKTVEVLSFKNIKAHLVSVNFGGCHFSLRKKRTVKIKHERVAKSIELWVTDLVGKANFIGEITYLIPTKQKNDVGEFNQIHIDVIEIHRDIYKEIGLGAIMAAAALLDAAKTAPFCSRVNVDAENQKSIGLFKKLGFEISKANAVGERLSTVKLPMIVKDLSSPLVMAFAKLEKAAKVQSPAL